MLCFVCMDVYMDVCMHACMYDMDDNDVYTYTYIYIVRSSIEVIQGLCKAYTVYERKTRRTRNPAGVRKIW